MRRRWMPRQFPSGRGAMRLAGDLPRRQWVETKPGHFRYELVKPGERQHEPAQQSGHASSTMAYDGPVAEDIAAISDAWRTGHLELSNQTAR
jgi:hypothetical protein